MFVWSGKPAIGCGAKTMVGARGLGLHLYLDYLDPILSFTFDSALSFF